MSWLNMFWFGIISSSESALRSSNGASSQNRVFSWVSLALYFSKKYSFMAGGISYSTSSFEDWLRFNALNTWFSLNKLKGWFDCILYASLSSLFCTSKLASLPTFFNILKRYLSGRWVSGCVFSVYSPPCASPSTADSSPSIWLSPLSRVEWGT